MKIASIDIKEFRQFKNLKLDLTYPKGHEKAGEPLDKVCIIGQSGTGKTNLLELIYGRTFIFDRSYSQTDFKPEYKTMLVNNEFVFKDGFQNSFKLEIGKEINPKLWSDSTHPSVCYLMPQRIELRDLESKHNSVIHEGMVRQLWSKINDNYKEHANERSKYIFALSNFVGKLATTEEIIKNKNEISRLKKEKEDWEAANPNPMVDIANLLNPIISKFGLKTRIDIYNLNQLNFIPIMDKEENEITEHQWSTGTNQIIYKTYPLFALKPENTIILIDEPENSLYPDIQTEIIEHYTRLAPTCQFFFATHSPIIASCFEPWEIVELKFNEEGEVYRELYYEGENHIDNYKIDPRYLRWDSILKKIFDLDVEGNEEERVPKLMELATLKGEIKAMKKNGASNGELEQKLQQIEKLAKILDVPVKLYEEIK